MKRVDLLRNLVNKGLRIFSLRDVREESLKIGLKDYSNALHHLKKEGWIESLKKGVYAITSESGFGPPPHDFEIAMALVSPCAISHWTALHYHHLTQQTPNIVYAITPTKRTRLPNKSLFYFIRVKPERYFGIQKIWVGESKVQITDPERTLLDGLSHPQYCGDFNEVISAFKMRGDNIDLEKIIEHSKKMSVATMKRLGLILEFLRTEEKWLRILEEVPMSGYRRLDPLGPERGKLNKRWKIIENI